MTTELDLLKAVPPKVVEEVYSDGVSDTLKEASKLGVDAVKTVRLILFPLQFAGMVQDRLAAYIRHSLSRVPEERRIAPAESLTLQIADRLRVEGEQSVAADMYVSLLARAMDRLRVGEAHPAFVFIISQLAPDEILLLRQIAIASPTAAYMRITSEPGKVMLKVDRDGMIHGSTPAHLRDDFCRMMVRPEELAVPSLLFTYIEHLVSLGIVVYWNGENIYSEAKRKIPIWECWFIDLNEFGRLFYSACLKDEH